MAYDIPGQTGGAAELAGTTTRENSTTVNESLAVSPLNPGFGMLAAVPDPELRAMLVEQRDQMIERIVFLEQNRDALTRRGGCHRSSTGASLLQDSAALQMPSDLGFRR